MTDQKENLLLALGLAFMTGILLTLLLHSNSGYLTRIIAGIGLFDIAVVAFLLVKNW